MLLTDLEDKLAQYQSGLKNDQQTFVGLFATIAGFLGIFTFAGGLVRELVAADYFDFSVLAAALALLWFPINNIVQWNDKRHVVAYMEDVLIPDIRAVLAETDPPDASPSSLQSYLSFVPWEDVLYTSKRRLWSQYAISLFRSLITFAPSAALVSLFALGLCEAEYALTPITSVELALILVTVVVIFIANSRPFKQLADRVAARASASAPPPAAP